MNQKLAGAAISLALLLSQSVIAAPSAEAAARGKALHNQNFTGGKPDTPSCTTCHGTDPRAAGRSRTGKTIEPMAVSVSPGRYQDPAKVEKWFKRNCVEVIGRECTAQEKSDWLAYMSGQ
jgi:mono/diheme cytochrome c family protein